MFHDMFVYSTVKYFFKRPASELVFWRFGEGPLTKENALFRPWIYSESHRIFGSWSHHAPGCCRIRNNSEHWLSTIFAFKSESCFGIFAFKRAFAFKYLLSNRPSPCSPVIMFLLDCDGGWTSCTRHRSRALYVPERLTYEGGLYIKKSAFSPF